MIMFITCVTLARVSPSSLAASARFWIRPARISSSSHHANAKSRATRVTRGG
jgi:hypothetical protein